MFETEYCYSALISVVNSMHTMHVMGNCWMTFFTSWKTVSRNALRHFFGLVHWNVNRFFHQIDQTGHRAELSNVQSHLEILYNTFYTYFTFFDTFNDT